MIALLAPSMGGAPAGWTFSTTPTVHEFGIRSTAGGLTVTTFTANPATVEEAQPATFYVNTTGGVPPLTYAYANLPLGCYSYNESPLPCIPSEVQKFNVSVQVTDSVGDVAVASTVFNVVSGHGQAPKVEWFNATPTSVAVSQPTKLSVIALSESSTATAVLSYTYFDLPPGCASFNQTPLVCVPSAPGTYTVHVAVADGYGDIGYGAVTFTVTGSAPMSSSGGPSFSLPMIWIDSMAVGVVGIALAAVLVVRSRRRRPPGSS